MKEEKKKLCTHGQEEREKETRNRKEHMQIERKLNVTMQRRVVTQIISNIDTRVLCSSPTDLSPVACNV